MHVTTDAPVCALVPPVGGNHVPPQDGARFCVPESDSPPQRAPQTWKAVMGRYRGIGMPTPKKKKVEEPAAAADLSGGERAMLWGRHRFLQILKEIYYSGQQ
jgi:hypothetical protein